LTKCGILHTYAKNNKIRYKFIKSKEENLQEAIDYAESVKDTRDINDLLKVIKGLSDAIIEYNK